MGDVPINLDGSMRLDALKLAQTIGNRMRTASNTTYSGLRFVNNNDIDNSARAPTPGVYRHTQLPDLPGNGEMTYQRGTLGDWKQDVHEVSDNGAEYTLDFTGPSVVIAGPRAPDQGEVEVFIDEVSQGRVSTHSKYQRMYQSIMYERHDLSDGAHTLKLVKRSGDKMRLDVVGVRMPVAPGQYRIRNRNSGKYLAKANYNFVNGAQLAQQPNNFDTRRVWNVREVDEEQASGEIYIVSSVTNASVNVQNNQTADNTRVVEQTVNARSVPAASI